MGTLLLNQSYKSQNRMATRIERSLNWNPSQCPTELSKVTAWFDRYNFDLLSGDHLTEVPALASLIELSCMISSNEEFTVHVLSTPKNVCRDTCLESVSRRLKNRQQASFPDWGLPTVNGCP